jgi:uncharacterized surface anchored protein
VPLGTYTVSETGVPAGYVGAADQTGIVVDSTAVVELTFTNTQGSIKVLKKDGSGEPLAGATFTITQTVGGSYTATVLDNDVNDGDPADGVILFENVPLGTYTVSETGVPAGYVGAADQTGIVVDSTAVVELTFTNTQVAGEVITPPVQPQVQPEGTLPTTGWNLLPLVLAAAVLMLLGMMALMLGVLRFRRS